EAPDWHLVIAGNPEDVALAERIRARIRQLGLADRVSLPGMLVDGAKVALLRRTSLFVQPSLHENFGISVAEALLFDLPCVVSDGVALATEIEQGGAGLRCEPRAEPLAAAMQRLMLDQDQRTQMAGRAGALAARFSPE